MLTECRYKDRAVCRDSKLGGSGRGTEDDLYAMCLQRALSLGLSGDVEECVPLRVESGLRMASNPESYAKHVRVLS